MAIQHVRASEMPTDRSAIEGDGFTATFGRFEAPAGPPGGWHHHGDQQVIAYVISGTIRVEWGANGGTLTELAPGDLVRIEPHTVHRESYAGTIEIVGFTVGPGPGRIDVDGPDRPSP